MFYFDIYFCYVKDEEQGNNWADWCKNQVKYRLPITEWLPKYKWKSWFIRDFIGGFTVACIIVPQSMALAIVAELNPISGVYSACFASFIYPFLGTMPINSYGPTAMAAILIGEIIDIYQENENNVELAKAITFATGVQFMVAFILNFSIIIVVFIPPFVSAFVTGSSLHIIVKSLIMMLGLKKEINTGKLALPLNIYLVYTEVTNTNLIDLITSVTVFNILLINQIAIKPLVKRCTDVVLPTEVIILGIASLISHLYNFSEYDVAIVGPVPQEFPNMEFPSMTLVHRIFIPSLNVAFLTYSTSMIVSSLFNENVDSDQELFALGIINIICSGLECFNVGSSMMRSVIVKTLGVKTLIASFITSFFLLCVVLWVRYILQYKLFYTYNI